MELVYSLEHTDNKNRLTLAPYTELYDVDVCDWMLESGDLALFERHFFLSEEEHTKFSGENEDAPTSLLLSKPVNDDEDIDEFDRCESEGQLYIGQEDDTVYYLEDEENDDIFPFEQMDEVYDEYGEYDSEKLYYCKACCCYCYNFTCKAHPSKCVKVCE